MNQISKTVRTTTSIVGTIGDVTVNINFENEIGKQPQYINAACSITPAVPQTGGEQPVEQPTYINVSRQSNGSTSVTLNGDKAVTEVAELIEEIKSELEIIATEGGIA